MLLPHLETHRTDRIGWLRAAVLGANDGIVSTSSLVMGVASAHTGAANILVAGVAGLVAGAMSMAAGEYVSVSSQLDTENADLNKERRELAEEPEKELKELTGIYVKRGLDQALATEVAKQLTASNALEAHARDELGISAHLSARPIQAALSSAGTFMVGAAMPLIVVLIAPEPALVTWLTVSTLLSLAALGGLSAYAGGAPVFRAIMRVTFWGAIALGITAGVGALVGTQI